LKYPYKSYPFNHPAFPKQDRVWRPALNVSLIYRHGKPCKPFECIVDSGLDYCLFHGAIGDAIGIDVKSGATSSIKGLAQGMGAEFYFHKVRLLVAGEVLEITAGFSYQLSVAGLLGQTGLFDNFIVTFDFTPHPPLVEVQRIRRN